MTKFSCTANFDHLQLEERSQNTGAGGAEAKGERDRIFAHCYGLYDAT